MCVPRVEVTEHAGGREREVVRTHAEGAALVPLRPRGAAGADAARPRTGTGRGEKNVIAGCPHCGTPFSTVASLARVGNWRDGAFSRVLNRLLVGGE